MLVADPKELRAAVPPGRRIMGLDVGTKTIGLALSDTRLIIASPLETIRRRRFAEDIAALFALMDRHEIDGLVIGLPLSLAGCAALPSHSKTAISVVMISARCRSSRRIAASLLSACREPTASRTR